MERWHSPEIDNFGLSKKENMGAILLEGMEFFSYHGCFREEQLIGTKFTVDLKVEADTSAAEVSDKLHETVDYVGLYRTVKKEMEQNAYLLEHVAWRIMESLKKEFPLLVSIDLKINKINPPIGGKMHQVCFATSWCK
jgi:dihydroneopterin aldolase